MSDFRILDFNYVQDPTVTVSATSENSEFPASNVQNPLRAKVWRSSSTEGTFIIDSTNKDLDFDEGGPLLHAILTEGTYTASELADEIGIAIFNAGGVNVYDGGIDSATGLWTISSGGPTLNLYLNSGPNKPTSIGPILGFDDSVDYTGSLSYTGAKIAIHTAEWLIIDLKTEEAIDSFAMVFDPIDGINYTEDAVLRLQANATSNFANPAVDVELTIDQFYSTITHFFTAPESYRYWAIKIVDPCNANLHVEVSKVLLSFATQLGQGPEIGFVDTLTDQSRSESNSYGHTYHDIYPSRRSFTFNHTALTEADTQTLFEIYRRVGNVKPVGIAMDTPETIYDKDRFFMYGRFTNDFKATNNFFTFFDQGIEILEAL